MISLGIASIVISCFADHWALKTKSNVGEIFGGLFFLAGLVLIFAGVIVFAAGML